MFERGETSGRKSRAMPLSLLSKGNRLFIPPTQSTSYYLPRAPIRGSGPDSMSVGVVRGLAVSVLCPSCAPLVLKLIVLKILALEFLAPRRSPQSRRRVRQCERLEANDQASFASSHLPRLPPLSSPPFTDARAATRSRARDKHRRSRGRRTFAFPGTSVSPHPDSCQSHGGRTRLPSRERCTRAPIPAWPRL